MRLAMAVRLACGASLLCASSATPCSLARPQPAATELVDGADVIVVAVARHLVPKQPLPMPPPTRAADLPSWLPTPYQSSLPGAELIPNRDPRRVDHVQFKVVETLKGHAVAPLLIQGVFAERDDFNDQPVPHNTARPQADGPCYASSYRRGAAYLLLLKKVPGGELSPYWSALSRTNDQVRPEADEWFAWVRKQVVKRR